MRLRPTFQPYITAQASLVLRALTTADQVPAAKYKWGYIMASAAERALPYQEPSITAFLTLSSFLCLLNVINHLLDKWIYCGLLGQVFIGVVWGLPGAQWIGKAIQGVFTQLGSLGLVLLVYEGGLSTSISALKANLFLSIAVAATGICLPIGLSFSLLRLANATSLQAFAAGAALCSTSLGTTFTVLRTSALTKSRLGVVLTSAAMMDDVVGLVMVQIISNLRSGSAGARATTVIRPVFVSLAFAVILPLCCRFVLLPGWLWLESNNGMLGFKHVLHRRETPFLLHTSLLLGFVTGASYAGTSNLFAAYLAGVMISWWDTLTAPLAGQERPSPSLATTTDLQDPVPEEGAGEGQSRRCRALEQYTNCPEPSEGSLVGDTTTEALVPKRGPSSVPEMVSKATQTISETNGLMLQVNSRTGGAVYERYYLAPVDRILKPLFFASIGFSIPISQMFRGSVIWRGIVYAFFMAVGKLACGLWLVRFDANYTFRVSRKDKKDKREKYELEPSPNPPCSPAQPKLKSFGLPKPRSLYPASILGSAMVARGEIGFLVSAIAQSNGIFGSISPDSSSAGTVQDLFLVVTWAIMLCTVIGPIAVGLIVRRVRRLQKQRKDSVEKSGQADPLGVWGLSSGAEPSS